MRTAFSRIIRPAGRGLFLVLLALCAAGPAQAQYFGRNKVQYENFQFKVLHTAHFDIYFYPAEEAGARDLGRMAERWYSRYRRLFDHTFSERKPIVLYANHADFEQTNVLSGFISEGTGGVTESLKNRVVMPLTGDYAGTDHVLGHELVHVFQYDIANAAEDSIGFRIDALPLWLIEGMAEYLSVGRDDPHTAMWMRDAILYDDFPSIKDLTTNPKYFPYRYGQALWAYIGGRWGDSTVPAIYRSSGHRGMNFAFLKYAGLNSDSLSVVWKQAVEAAYRPALEGKTHPDSAGERILAPDKGSGEINLAPAVSPDGTRVAFLSEKDLFSIDLFVADAHTGKVLKKLVSSDSNPHFDALRFIDSAGSWSPDGKRLALVVFAKGDNDIVIVNAESGDFERRLDIAGVGAINNPAWSPDGHTLAFSGAAGGISDLYLYDLDTKQLRQLTTDKYADLAPSWSPDGSRLAWVTDRGPGTDFETLTYEPMHLAVMDVASGSIRNLEPFPGAKHINPEFSPDGKSLYFISDRGGFSDIYRAELDSGKVYQVTRLATGVSGITELSPAMSVARETGRVMFSVFAKGNYNVYGLEAGQARGELLPPEAFEPTDRSVVAQAPLPAASADTVAAESVAAGAAPDSASAHAGIPAGESGTSKRPAGEGLVTVLSTAADTSAAPASKPHALVIPGDEREAEAEAEEPPPPATVTDMPWNLPPELPWRHSAVAAYLHDPYTGLSTGDEFSITSYHPSLKLDYVGATAVGVAVDRYGAAVGGGVSGYFSDMLGNHEIGVALQANGGVKDIGAQAIYQNRTHRWNWGAVVGHVPYLSYYTTVRDTTVDLDGSQIPAYKVEQIRERVFVDSGALLGSYPFSTTRRLEASAGYTHLGYDQEIQTQVQTGNLILSDRTRSGVSPPGLGLFETSLALVGDNSFFGFTSPIKGQRYRVEVDPTYGTLNFQTLLLDYRRYVFLKPVTVAFRGIHVGRYGVDSESDRLNPLFLGYKTLVRGYSTGSFDLQECGPGENCPPFDRLVGSRIGVANLEVRVPVIGTSQFGLINFPYIPTELAGFLDGGVAWTKDQSPVLKLQDRSSERIPVFSTGLSARINVLGALVMEIYYAYPFQRPDKGAHFGFQIAPGW